MKSHRAVARIEQSDHPGGRLKKFERMRRGRSIDNLELERARLMEIVKLLEGGERLRARELHGETLVEGVGENSATGCLVGNEALDDGVPGAFYIEHHRGQLEGRREPGVAELLLADARRMAAEAGQSERVAQALRGIDCDNRGLEAGGRTGEAERRRDGGFTDAAGAEQNGN